MGRGLFEGWHLIILALLIIALFGAKRLPDAARSIGRSMRVFRSEVDEMKKENAASKSSASSETVRGESITQQRADEPVSTPEPETDGSATERSPRSGSSGPAA